MSGSLLRFKSDAFENFDVNVPSTVSDFGSAANSLCYQPGTKKETVLTDGNIRCDIDVFARRGENIERQPEKMQAIVADYFAGARWAQENNSSAKYRVYEIGNYGVNERVSLVVDGWIKQIPNSVVNVYGSRGHQLFRITYIRLPYWEQVAVQHGTEGHGDLNAVYDTVELNTEPGGRIRTTRITVDSMGSSYIGESAVPPNKVWIGIQPNLDSSSDRSSNYYDPSIDMDTAQLGWRPRTIDRQAGTNFIAASSDSQWSSDRYISVDYSDGLADWALRFGIRMDDWNETTSDHASARNNMMGPHIVLMRYRLSEDPGEKEIGIRPVTFWAHAPDQLLQSPPEVWIKPFNYSVLGYDSQPRLQTMEIGEINIPGDTFGYDSFRAFDLSAFCFGIESAIFTEPGWSWEDGLPELYIDKFIFIPKRHYVKAMSDFAHSGSNISLDIVTDEMMNVSAYWVSHAVGEEDNLEYTETNTKTATIIAGVSEIDSNDWRSPALGRNVIDGKPLKKLVIASDTDNYFDLTDIRLRASLAVVERGDWLL